jgi:hypothetical protein
MGFNSAFKGLIDFTRFKGKKCLLLQAVDCQRTQRPVPEERNPQAHRCRNIRTGRLKKPDRVRVIHKTKNCWERRGTSDRRLEYNNEKHRKLIGSHGQY